MFNINSFRKFYPSSSNGLKVQNFGRPDRGGSTQTSTPTFSRTKVLPDCDIFNRSNFEYSAFSGLKVDGIGRKRKKKKKQEKRKKKKEK